jgi:hypothetical protein
MTEQARSKWQRDLEEMEILLMTLGFSAWVAFWAMVHYGVIALV